MEYRKSLSFIFAIAMLAPMGCEENSALNRDLIDLADIGLTTERTEEDFVGIFLFDETVISFNTQVLPEGIIDLTMNINEKPFQWRIDTERQEYWVDGYDFTLVEEDTETLRNLVIELGALLNENDWNSAQDQFIMAAASYWAESPPGFVHGVKHFSNWTDPDSTGGIIPIKNNVCLQIGSFTPTAYDNDNSGNERNTPIVGMNWGTTLCGSGNFACMGSCGAGCNQWGSGYTKDCLEHDICRHNDCADGLENEYNCSDAYKKAQDDFVKHLWSSKCDGSFGDI